MNPAGCLGAIIAYVIGWFGVAWVIEAIFNTELEHLGHFLSGLFTAIILYNIFSKGD